MRKRVKELMDAAVELSVSEQLELLAALSSQLQTNFQSTDKEQEFWQGKSLEELIQEQNVTPKQNIRDYAKSFWPEEETVDDFNQFLQEQRRADMSREL